MTDKKITAPDILQHLGTYDLWNIGIQEVCQAIARALQSKKYGLIKKNGRNGTIALHHGLSEKSFQKYISQKKLPLFTLHDGKHNYLMYFFQVSKTR